MCDDFLLEKGARCNTLVITRHFVRERPIIVWRRRRVVRRAWWRFVDNGPPFISIIGDDKMINRSRRIEFSSLRHCVQFFLGQMLDDGTANGISEDVDRSAEAIPTNGETDAYETLILCRYLQEPIDGIDRANFFRR